MDAAIAQELAEEMIVKHDLALALQLMQDTVVDILKEMGLVKLKRLGFQQAAQAGRLASFAIDYCFQGFRFYEAWRNVDLILLGAEETQFVVDQMGRTITRITDKVTELRGELQRLEGAKKAGEDSRKQLLRELRSKDYQEAHLMGEWFANETGIRAPGGAIQEDR